MPFDVESRLRSIEIASSVPLDTWIKWDDPRWPFVLEDRLNKVLPQTKAPWCIAGGAIRDYHLRREPNDIDVFYLSESYHKALYYDLDTGNPIQMPGTVDKPGKHYCDIGFYSMDEYSDSVREMATLEISGKKIHLIRMISYPKRSENDGLCSVSDILDQFDLNICRFGFLGGNFVHEVRDYIDLLQGSMKLKRKNARKPHLHLGRLFRFSSRYGFKIDFNDIVDISAEILVSVNLLDPLSKPAHQILEEKKKINKSPDKVDKPNKPNKPCERKKKDEDMWKQIGKYLKENT